MKKQAALGQKLHTLRHELSVQIASNAALRLALRCGAAFAGGFLLAGVRLLGRNVPAALALAASLPFSLPAICAYLGAAAGYAVFWGLSAALEPVAAGFLLLAGSCLLGWIAVRHVPSYDKDFIVIAIPRFVGPLVFLNDQCFESVS